MAKWEQDFFQNYSHPESFWSAVFKITKADEVIQTETCAELPAERSVLDVSNLDEFAARYS